ncbi:MAG: hypothetical protein WD035_06030 [Balneolaceae bacterium]
MGTDTFRLICRDEMQSPSNPPGGGWIIGNMHYALRPGQILQMILN